jgi:alpha-D-ribose 1-methylphosphonate 5-triphosphate synthase subunit PhnI
MYVAVKGGERAILNSQSLLAETRRGDTAIPEISTQQIEQQLGLAVDRVMTEGSLYDRDLAALAIKQASGDVIEAIFLLRAFRATLPRFGYSEAVDTSAMTLKRRISATFKDLPGGQVLGPTYDYTQRLLDFSLASDSAAGQQPETPGEFLARTATAKIDGQPSADVSAPVSSVTELLGEEGLIEAHRPDDGDPEPGDLTREPLSFPASRAERLQNLARGDEGFLLSMGYSTQRGYANNHPFAGEIRYGLVEVEMIPEELGFAIVIGEIDVTECQMVNQFAGSKSEPPQFTRGYGLAFGHSERKSMAVALCDRALRAEELGEAVVAPAQMQEFVLSHSDNLESSGFVQHLKLPHYVDFQSELELVRKMRAAHHTASAAVAPTTSPASLAEAAE